MLNNLAGVCGELGATVLEGRFLERAQTVDPALASGNVAKKLAHYGLMDHARKELELATADEGHDSVVSARRYLAQQEKAIEENLATLDSNAIAVKTFYDACADAQRKLASLGVVLLPGGRWTSETITLSLQPVSKSRVEAILTRGEYDYKGVLESSAIIHSGWLKRQKQAPLIGGPPEWIRVQAASVENKVQFLVEEKELSDDPPKIALHHGVATGS